MLNFKEIHLWGRAFYVSLILMFIGVSSMPKACDDIELVRYDWMDLAFMRFISCIQNVA
ncbi:Uncharacterised protein [Moraxella caprae]|uniref:Uncharacterized protein n=2 Tax=Moraxella TaxID=475 RepID=A0A378R1A7_9GAMM|nr:Uncharacterised protein [Moraxella caprae]